MSESHSATESPSFPPPPTSVRGTSFHAGRQLKILGAGMIAVIVLAIFAFRGFESAYVAAFVSLVVIVVTVAFAGVWAHDVARTDLELTPLDEGLLVAESLRGRPLGAPRLVPWREVTPPVSVPATDAAWARLRIGWTGAPLETTVDAGREPAALDAFAAAVRERLVTDPPVPVRSVGPWKWALMMPLPLSLVYGRLSIVYLVGWKGLSVEDWITGTLAFVILISAFIMLILTSQERADLTAAAAGGDASSPAGPIG